MGFFDFLLELRLDSLNKFDSQQRKIAYQYIKRLAEYLYTNEISQIAFIDSSARTAWIGLNTYWNLHFPKRTKPRMYFFNPDGFERKHSEKNFPYVFKTLMTNKNKPLVIFDTCCHTGSTMEIVCSLLTELGFEDQRVITARSPEMRSGITPAYRLDENLDHVGCYPFGSTLVIRKGRKIVCETARENCDYEAEISLRRKLKKVIIKKGR